MTHPSRTRAAVAVAGAAALLAGLLVPTAAAADDDPTTLDDLVISEYVEGSSNNKAIEIFNGTGAEVDLTGYALKYYFNGSSSAGLTITLTETVAAGDVHVVAQASANATILAQADQTNGSGWYNGDDAITLVSGDAVIDSLGQVGVDPGSQWGTGLVSTADNTLRRKADVCTGDTDPTDVFDPEVQWDGYAQDLASGLGWHVACGAGEEPGDPGDPTAPGVCGDAATLIGVVQGSGAASPRAGTTVTVEGVVVGDFQHSGSYQGYYVQDAGDDDSATSDGIFVFAPGGDDVSVGDAVRVTGAVSEHFGLTEITVSSVDVCTEDGALPAPTELTLPLLDHEPYEGMYVTFAQDLAILEYFNYGRYGEIVLGVGDETSRQHQPTAVHEPGSVEAHELARYNASHRIMLDDGLGAQNPAFLRHPDGEAFTLDNRFRGGDTVTDVAGVLDYRFSEWGIQPTDPAAYTAVNGRPEVPEVGGTTTVASFNVLNYFTTLTSEDRDARGADTEEEFLRQEAKIVAAITEMDADIVGLIEIENNGDEAVGRLVQALNAAAGEPRWAFVSTGPVGTDAITTAFIYQPAQVEPVGDFAVLDTSEDPRFLDDLNRPALAQTFVDLEAGGRVTVVNNHLKSKGSDCDDVQDPDTGDGSGNCNGVRTTAADALGDWANGDPTGTGTEEVLIIGDLNSYDKESPIDALVADGFTDLLLKFQGEHAYSYVFDGQLGYLDYAMASAALAESRVTGAAAWNINADEPSILDYDMTFKPPTQDAIYAPDPYRSSDHDPVLVGLDLDLTAPVVEAIAEPPHIWPPNGKWRNVTTVVLATDNVDADPTITLVGAETNGRGEIEVVSDSRFRVRAVLGASYTITYDVTDDSGNTTTEAVTVAVAKPGKGKGR